MPSSTPRPNWDDTWFAVARNIAKRSLCDRDQVGAVIVDKNNRIVPMGTGYNGPPAGFQHDETGCANWCVRSQMAKYDQLKSDYSDCPSLHAEANALLCSDRSSREGGTIYVTSGVCFGCAKVIANSGLALVMVDPQAPGAIHRNCERSYAFLESCGITVVTG